MDMAVVERPETSVAQPTHPLAIIDRAIERGIDPDNLSKLMALQAQWEERRAAEVFASAVAGFQAECPLIQKKREVRKSQDKGGGLMYRFASYDDIKIVTRPIETRHGISTTFDIRQTEDGKISATCRVRVGSHFEDHTFMVPVPKGMNTNQAQDYGAALSYVKRYCYCAALDIVITDEDDDAAGLLDFIGPKEIGQLNDLITAKGVDLKRFLVWASEAAKYEIEALDRMPLKLFPAAMDMLKKRKAGAK